jgi:hypothetical protein
VTHRLVPGAVSALLLVGPLCGGCTSPEVPAGQETGSTSLSASQSTSSSPSSAEPSSAAELESLLVDEVPSGLPPVPDDELDPPAGEKTIDDVARYGEDAAQQRAVLEQYGYRWGWERFWRSGDALTSVFIDQFRRPDGAGSYAEDLARNDADYYGGTLDDAPGDLPDGCVLMVRDDPSPQRGLAGPAAFAWCAAGIFTVSIAAVAGSPAAARAELAAVTVAQLERIGAG